MCALYVVSNNMMFSLDVLSLTFTEVIQILVESLTDSIISVEMPVDSLRELLRCIISVKFSPNENVFNSK